jgi:hypothetical protein
MSRGPTRNLTTEDVYELLDERDRSQRPLATSGWLIDELGYSRPTVTNRLEELADDGVVIKHNYKNTRLWSLSKDAMVTPGDGRGMCPECHGTLKRDNEYDPGFRCQNCGTALAQLHDGEETTKYGRTVARGIKMQAWWMELPERVRSFIVTVSTVFMDVDTPEGVDFRPENLTFPGDPAKNASAREDDAAK